MLVLAVVAAWLALPLVHLPEALFASPPPSLELLDRAGRPLRTVREGDGAFAQRTDFADIPPSLVAGTLAAEDKRFWQHPGVDWRASLRAAWGFVRNRRVISGGSTITQQLIKLAEPRPRTLRTKIIEAAQALRLEQVWSKQQILAAYLNRLDYGNLNVGCAAAAQFYFDKPLRDLSVAEAALLAGLPQAPTRLNPHRHLARATKRQQWILHRMEQNGWLSAAERERAAAETLRLASPRRSFEAPHFVEMVLEAASGCDRQSAADLLPSRAVDIRARKRTGSDERSHTTLDLELNHFAERTLRQHLARLRSQHVRQGAVVVLDNRRGGVLALVGSDDFFSPDAGQVNGAWAARSAGSTLKPFTYLLAFEQGATAASVVADLPAEFATTTGIFAPVNYNRRCHGPMRYRLALANSLNISAVKVLASIGGPEVLLERLRECGLTTLRQPADFYGLGLTIGNAEVRLLELANAYACLARLGEWRPLEFWHNSRTRGTSAEVCDLRFTTCDLRANRTSARKSQIVNRKCLGEAVRLAAPVSNPAPTIQRVFDADAAWLIADILRDNDARALAFGVNSPLRFEFPVACKTGTSSDFRDNWALGYTPEFTVGVWVGNFDGTPMERVSGVSGAAPILHALFEHLHARYGTTWYPRPTNIVERAVHCVTGKLLADGVTSASPAPLNGERILQTSSRIEPLNHPLTRPSGTLSPTGGEGRVRGPRMTGRFMEKTGVRAETNQKSTTRAADVTLEKFLASRLPPVENAADYDAEGRVLLPAEYGAWLATGDNWLAARAVSVQAAPSLRLVSPLPGTVVFLDPDLPASSRQLALKAEAPAAISWSSDSLACQRGTRGTFAQLTEGRHRLVVRCAQTGSEVETWIEVKAL